MARGRTKGKGKGSQGQNRAQGEDFLKKNQSKDQVITTASGLQYQVIEKVEGEAPDSKANLTIHQRVSLIDGTLIEDTYKTGFPEKFPFNEAIPGLLEGISLMTTGARYKFFIPSDLAWGKRGAGDKIGPHAVLIIDLKLVEWF